MKPLHPLYYTPFSTEELRPEGWLRRQLILQAEGLGGNLDRVWPDIRDSRWIGGPCEGWERVPYWLDGFIPLAWLLDDRDMQARAANYINGILTRQQPDGWICPCTDEERPHYDVWAAFLVCKVLVMYADFSGDERIESVVYRALRQLNRHLDRHTLFNWGQARWFECLIPLFWLYERRPEPWMMDLCFKLEVQGLDWRRVFEDWRYEEPDAHGVWSSMRHVVNISMALKVEALCARLTGDVDGGDARARRALNLLLRDHGMAVGHFTGDECLSGTSPIQGTELCGVVEAMYSYEHLLSIMGDCRWGDMLERLAFNALPAAVSPDMWSHQYDQQSNQIACVTQPSGRVVFRTNNGEANRFGLEPHFGCCTANFGQGWPKFAMSTMMRTKGGLAVTAIAPSVLRTEIQGRRVECRIVGDYPFEDEYTVRVTVPEPMRFSLDLRIPGFARRAMVDGQPVPIGEMHRVERLWMGATTVRVALGMDAELTPRRSGLCYVSRGPLVYSLAPEEVWQRVEYTRDGVERKFPYCDYDVTPASDWQYAFAGDRFAYGRGTVGETPFSPDGAPCWLDAELAPIEWPAEYGVCAAHPGDVAARGPVKKKRLIPYGCTNLRLTEMPYLG